MLLSLALPASLWADEGEALQFNDDLSFALPAGWQHAALDLAPPAPENFDFGPNPFVVLVQAYPLDASRDARLTVVRDFSINTRFGSFGKNENLRRLHEMAVARGYRPEKFQASGEAAENAVEFATAGEVTGISPQGRRRVFAAVAFKQMTGYDVRCYWEFDSTDSLARQEYETWLASLASRTVKISDVIAGSASLVGTGDVAASSAQPGSAPEYIESAPPPSAKSKSKTTPVVAAPEPAASPASPGVVSAKVSEFIEKNRNALVVIEGENGRGSGFVCNFNGQPTALTNAHVLAGNPKPHFTTMDGRVLTLGEAGLAIDHDVCRLAATTTEGLPMLELMTEADGVPKIGDPIAVLGNSEGAGVIKPLEGTIVGLGPNLVEVNAPFVPGNSGSPIIHVPTGKVIGIATYLIIRKVNENDKKGMESSVRRFGYRLDSIKTWEPVNWPRFYAQATQAQSIVDVGEEFANLLAFLRKKSPMPQLGNNAVRRAVRTFEDRLNSSRRLSEADLAAARREFLGNLRSATRSDLVTFDTRTAYDFFRRQVADETKFRDSLYEAFTRALESNR